jgi:hypothetical protein
VGFLYQKIPSRGFFSFRVFGYLFDAFRADLHLLAVYLFFLKVNLIFSKGFDLGMADAIACLRTSPANAAYSAHVIVKREA